MLNTQDIAIEALTCYLITWVDGEQKQFVPTVNDAECVCELIGKLHKHSSFWEIPSSFTRPSFDNSRISQSLEKLKLLANGGELNKNDVEILQLAGECTILMINDIERTPGNWGIIHADLISSNFVFHEQLTGIDSCRFKRQSKTRRPTPSCI